MKTSTVIGACLAALLLAAFGGGYWAGQEASQKASSAQMAGLAEQGLALDLEVLNELDHGDPAKVRWMIQAATAGRFGDIVEHADFDDGARLKFRCRLLERYKQYHLDNHLFEGASWQEILSVDGMQEAARQRRVFMDETLPTLCKAFSP